MENKKTTTKLNVSVHELHIEKENDKSDCEYKIKNDRSIIDILIPFKNDTCFSEKQPYESIWNTLPERLHETAKSRMSEIPFFLTYIEHMQEPLTEILGIVSHDDFVEGAFRIYVDAETYHNDNKSHHLIKYISFEFSHQKFLQPINICFNNPVNNKLATSIDMIDVNHVFPPTGPPLF